MSFACISLYTPHMCLVPIEEKHIRPPEIGVTNGISQHVGARNQTQIFCKSHKCSQSLSYLSSPSLVEFWSLTSG